MKKIYILLGPTSSGKTRLALSVCATVEGQIISADSRQIYKHMDIGTGKLPIKADIKVKKADAYWELNSTKVWGYDLVEPDEYFSGYDYAKFALTKAGELQNVGITTLLVGGTGFYIDLVIGNVVPSNIKPDFNLRKKLEILSQAELKEKLMSLNPEVANNVDLNNPVRIMRQIEKASLKTEETDPLPYLENTQFVYVLLSASNEYLYQKVDDWLETVWQNGLLSEVETLASQGYGNSVKLQGLVYKSALAVITNSMPEDVAKQRAKFDLHAYIRRQKTYFKRMPVDYVFDVEHEPFEALQGRLSGIINL